LAIISALFTNDPRDENGGGKGGKGGEKERGKGKKERGEERFLFQDSVVL
jgi:hypothetical protein